MLLSVSLRRLLLWREHPGMTDAKSRHSLTAELWLWQMFLAYLVLAVLGQLAQLSKGDRRRHGYLWFGRGQVVARRSVVRRTRGAERARCGLRYWTALTELVKGIL